MKTWSLDDAAALARQFKYTFYVPPSDVLNRLEKGHLARLIFMFESDQPGTPRAERMWVEIQERNGDRFTGNLTNQPVYIRDLQLGDVIAFETKHIIDSDLKSDEADLVEKYIDRCFATNEVLRNGKKIQYLYREESLGEQQDGIKDSGWRMMAGDESQEYVDNPSNLQLVSLGAVLNLDDSILPLLDAPTGSEFIWDDDLGQFVEITE